MYHHVVYKYTEFIAQYQKPSLHFLNLGYTNNGSLKQKESHMPSCLVDAKGRVYPKINAYPNLNTLMGVGEFTCSEFVFDILSRQIRTERISDFTKFDIQQEAAKAFFDRCFGSVGKLIIFAEQGRLSEAVLASLLITAKREEFLKSCTDVAKKFTERCPTISGPCLEDGCALSGEVCLNALLASSDEYFRECASAWKSLFVLPENRIANWR